MAEPLADRVIQRISQATELYHRLPDGLIKGKEPGKVRIVLE
jgi:hypothetical protein